MAMGESYEEFVAKFKPKKTTDDCYTPKIVYEAIKDWVVDRYKLQGRPIVRPFYPGGDFENYDYPENCVVIDNPPFSILKKIKDFYIARNIDFFLFAPGLTLFSSHDSKKVHYIVTGTAIVYENGANVNTSFVTNLGKHRVFVSGELSDIIREANRKEQGSNKRARPRYTYPTSVITSALLKKVATGGVDLTFDSDELMFVRRLDEQAALKRVLFGGGYIISKAAEERFREAIIKTDEAKRQYNAARGHSDHEWRLSDREERLREKLGNSNAPSTSD